MADRGKRQKPVGPLIDTDSTPMSLIQRELEAAIDGEVRFDKVSRALYSTDASVYQIEPLGVVIPKSQEAVIRAVTIAARHGVPITPRGGGTWRAVLYLAGYVPRGDARAVKSGCDTRAVPAGCVSQRAGG